MVGINHGGVSVHLRAFPAGQHHGEEVVRPSAELQVGALVEVEVDVALQAQRPVERVVSGCDTDGPSAEPRAGVNGLLDDPEALVSLFRQADGEGAVGEGGGGDAADDGLLRCHRLTACRSVVTVGKVVKGGTARCLPHVVAVQPHAHPFPVAELHREGVARSGEVAVVGAVQQGVAVRPCVRLQTEVDGRPADGEGGSLRAPVLKVEAGVRSVAADAQQAVRLADAGDAAALSVRQVVKVHAYGRRAAVAHGLLGERIACPAEVVCLQGVEGERAGTFGQRPGIVHGVVVELPLQSERRSAKVVIGAGHFDGHVTGTPRLGPRCDRFADTVAVDVHADHGPVILPVHGLQVDDASQRVVLLEVEEEPFALRRVDHRSLVRSVDVGRAAFEHHALLIRAVDALRAQDGLPPLGDAPFGDAEVVVPVALVNLRALRHRSAVDGPSLVEQTGAVGTHAVDDDGTCAVDAASEVRLPVIVPEGARVFPLGHVADVRQGTPRPGGVGGVGHEESLVGCAEENPELPVVVADGRCPRAAGIAFVRVPAREVEAAVDLGEEAPVDHVVRDEHLHAQEVEVGGDHVVLLAHTDDVGVGVVSVEDGVDVCAIALVAPSVRRRLLGGKGDGQRRHAQKEREELFQHKSRE